MKVRAAVLREMGLPAPYAQSRPVQVTEVELEGHRTESEVTSLHDGSRGHGHDVPRAAGGGDGELQLPLLARFLDDVEPLDHPVRLAGLGCLLL